MHRIGPLEREQIRTRRAAQSASLDLYRSYADLSLIPRSSQADLSKMSARMQRDGKSIVNLGLIPAPSGFTWCRAPKPCASRAETLMWQELRLHVPVIAVMCRKAGTRAAQGFSARDQDLQMSHSIQHRNETQSTLSQQDLSM